MTDAEVPAGFTDTSAAAAPPNDTCIPARKPLPVSVTVVPPPTGPLSGATEVRAGAAT